MENTLKIVKALQENDKPLKPGEIAELAGVERTEADKIIKKLKAEGKIESPKKCYYCLVK